MRSGVYSTKFRNSHVSNQWENPGSENEGYCKSLEGILELIIDNDTNPGVYIAERKLPPEISTAFTLAGKA